MWMLRTSLSPVICGLSQRFSWAIAAMACQLLI